MTKDVFKSDFKRLCEGFRYDPRSTQIDAFYERLQHCQIEDWREAVTDLLCAPRFPMNLEIILDTVEKRAEQRRRATANHERGQAHVQTAQLRGSSSMWDALAERPDLLASMERLLNKAMP